MKNLYTLLIIMGISISTAIAQGVPADVMEYQKDSFIVLMFGQNSTCIGAGCSSCASSANGVQFGFFDVTSGIYYWGGNSGLFPQQAIASPSTATLGDQPWRYVSRTWSRIGGSCAAGNHSVGGTITTVKNFTVRVLPRLVWDPAAPNFSCATQINYNLIDYVNIKSGGVIFKIDGNVVPGGNFNRTLYPSSFNLEAIYNYADGPVTISNTTSNTAGVTMETSIPSVNNICADDAWIPLTDSFTTNGLAVTFSCVSGTCNPGAMFPTVGGKTSFNPGFAGAGVSYTTTIRATSTNASGFCANNINLVFNVGATYSINAGTDQIFCNEDAAINLNSAPGVNLASLTPVWSGAGVSGNTFTPSSVTPGTYTITLQTTNAGGCTRTDTKSITINGNPGLPTITNPAPICSGNTQSFTLPTVAGIVYDIYNASTGGAIVTGGTGRTGTFTSPVLSTTTNYFVQARNSTTGCLATARRQVTITVNTTPVIPGIAVTPGATSCGPTNFILTGSGITAGHEYRWYDQNDVFQATGNSFGTGTLAVGSYTYKATIRNTTTGCESAFKTQALTVNNLPTISSPVAGTNFDICTGSGSLNLNTLVSPNPTGGSYSSTNSTISSRISGSTLSLTGINPGVYPLRYSYTSGCTQTVDVSLVFSAGVTTPSVSDKVNCEPGLTTTLNVNSPDGSVTYQWFEASSGGAAIHTGTSFTTPVLNSTKTYYIQGEKGTCTSPRDPATVTVVDFGTVNAGPDLGYCDNNVTSLQLDNAAFNVTPAGGTWSGPGVSGNIFTGTTLANNASYEVTYTVTSNGCSKSDTRLISLGFSVSLKIDGNTAAASGNEVDLEELVLIEHNYPNATATEWDFGDGIKLKELKGAHYFYSVGEHTIKVKIKQEGGCENEFTFVDFVDVIGNNDIITGADDPLTAVKETTAFPMPFESRLMINSKADLGVIGIELIAMDGSTRIASSQHIAYGDNEILTAESNSIKPGVYILRLKSKSVVQTIKVVKK